MNANTPPPTWTMPLDSDRATLPLAGGKGANLARLALAGFPVPAGFLIATPAYEAFVAANGLAERILAVIPAGPSPSAQALEEASAAIRALFAAGRLPEGLAGEIVRAYERLGRPAVAVRSSATAEDLPEMSFAGQQETYLNVSGDDALLGAVVDCWSSLWTARAIGYRQRNGVPHTGSALAVVVQRMVESRAAGVLFTANPLTGRRKETVVDATVGLGEALVSGQVEPDHYVVDMATGQITGRALGAKALSVRGRPGGGTEVVPEAPGAGQALPDTEIRSLAALGERVAGLYGTPQDLEWAWDGQTLYLLQARPITSLFPLPAGLPPEPLMVFVSFGAVQGMLAPITPLGRDVVREILAQAGQLLGNRATRQTQTALYTAGERLWINVTPLFRNSAGRKALRGALAFVEPAAGEALAGLWNEPGLQPTRQGVSLRARVRLARFFVPIAGNLLLNLLAPQRRRRLIARRYEEVLESFRARCALIRGDRRARLERVAALLPQLLAKLAGAFQLMVSGVAGGMASLNWLNALSRGIPLDAGPTPPDPVTSIEGQPGPGDTAPRSAWDGRVLLVTRGVPHNPTTEMDLALWQVAQAIRRDPAARAAFEEGTGAGLAARYLAGKLPATAQQALAPFMERYGARGLAEFDVGRPRWSEEPAHVMEVVTGYLQITDEERAPDVAFARGAANARAAIERLAAGARKAPGGWIRARLVRLAAGRARALLGLREAPKFFLVRVFAILRHELLRLGREMAAAGELRQPDDLFYLTFSELASLAANEDQDWPGLIAQRRDAYQRELLRRQIPRLLLSDGRAFYGGLSTAALPGTLAGSPVSPGTVEGRVRVVFDPRHAELQPGEILVCPGTDPSWTPLFLTAAGLVMEVGGMMTHGAVVAREYGIPAVVGVDRATQRLQTGQRIAVDGSTGAIRVLEAGS